MPSCYALGRERALLQAATPPERKRKEADIQTAFEIYREIIKENISYDILMQEMKFQIWRRQNWKKSGHRRRNPPA